MYTPTTNLRASEPLPDIPKEGNADWYSEEETERRALKVLRRMLELPPLHKGAGNEAKKTTKKTLSPAR